MSRMKRLVACLAMAALLTNGVAVLPAQAQAESSASASARPDKGWKPQSKRNWWDRTKDWFTGGDGKPKSRKLPGVGVPRQDPLPASVKAPPARRVREVAGRRTANTKVFQLADGRLQEEMSAFPLHYRSRDGRWRDIDARVRATGRQGFVFGNETNSFRSFFGDRPGGQVRVEAAGAELTLGAQGLGAGAAMPGRPKVAGNMVTYAADAQGVGLSYEVTRDALKESIVLSGPVKDGTFEFTIRAKGVRAAQQPDGSIAFYKGDWDGRPVLIIPKPFMHDAADDASSPYGKAWSDKVSQSVRWDGRAGLLRLTIKADAGWLNDARRKYPVVIDPTIKIAPTPTQSQDTMILSDAPDDNYDSSWRLSAGTTTTGKARTLVKFPLTAIPAGTRIDSAQLQLYYDQHHTTNSKDVTVEARRATTAWDETTATWNNANNNVGELSANVEHVDDGIAGKTAATGTWPTQAHANGFNGDYAYNKDSVTGDTYTWTPRLTETGNYRVDVHYVEGADRATNAPYTVTYNGGTKAYTVDQYHATESKGVWKTLGTHPFVAGTAGKITLGDVAGKAMVADAVRLVKEGTAVRKAGDEGSHWHSFSVGNTVQSWLDGAVPNHGFVVKARDEATLGQGGPRYEGSLFFYNGETATYPKLVVTYGRPGVEVNSPTTITATGADLSWPAYTDPSSSSADDIVEYQVHRSVWQTFTPSQATMVAPVAGGTTRYTDTTARPTPADSADPFGHSYYYMVAVKTRDGKITPGPTQIARVPKAGRVTKIYQTGVTDTTLTKTLPDANQDKLAGQAWLMSGNNSPTYGTSRAVVKFPALTDIPATARVLDAQVKLWTAGVDGSNTAAYELRGLTRAFNETGATWNKADAATAWTTAGGDYGTVAGTGSGWFNDPQQRNLTATSLAQQWVATPASNKGAMIKLANEATPAERAIFVSSEADEPQLRPQLVVTYLETTPENTYYAPGTADRMATGSTNDVEVTLTNTTTVTWKAGERVLSYHWRLPDGTDVSNRTEQLHTALPKDLVPGDSVTVNAKVKTPPDSAEDNPRTEYSLDWDVYNKATGRWLSQGDAAPATGQRAVAGAERAQAGTIVGWLSQKIAVAAARSDQLGLEKFYAYTGKNTGAGSTVMNNIRTGNAVWSYNAFSNPSRGLATFLRLTYNSKDISRSSAGFGWSIQASTPNRLGAPLDFFPPIPFSRHPLYVTLTDGDGTSHGFARDTKGTLDPKDDEFVSPPGVHMYLQQLAECGWRDENSRAWVMTRPDRTQFFYDCDGYLTASVDNNGNQLDFTYEVRKSWLCNKPIKYLRYITDPASRQTLTIDYYRKGDAYSYIDANGTKVQGSNLTNLFIIDNIKQITDISGRKLALTYTHHGLLGELVDGEGTPAAKKFTFGYDTILGFINPKLVKVTDPRGHTTKLDYYDLAGFKWWTKAITDRLGNSTGFTYNLDGTTRVTDAENRTTSYKTDGRGRPIQTTNAKNQTTKLDWDDDNNVTRLEEPPATSGATPAVSTWKHDPKTGYPLEIKDAEAVKNGWAATTLTYQTGLNGHIADLITKQSPEGRKWTFTYTTEGDLATVTDPVGNATPTAGDYTTTYTYDTWGQLQTVKNANGHTTTNSEFDLNGYPRKITDPLNNATNFVYDERGQVAKVTDARGKDTTQTYDTFGRPLENKVPKDQAAGQFITTPAPDYDSNDNVVKATAPNGGVTTATYDDTDQLIASLAPKDEAGDPERKTSYTYDKVGNVKTLTEPKGNLTPTAGDYTTTYGYDEIYQQISMTNAKADKITYVYDDVGNVVTVVDPRKNATADPADYTTKTNYDLNHRVKVVTDAIGKTTKTTYDRDGLITATTDQANTTTEISLDARGKPIEVKAPHKNDGGTTYRTTRYGYDQVGNRTKVTTPRGVATADDPDDLAAQTVYDELNRVKETWTRYDKDDTRYKTPDKTLYSYDAVGRLAKLSAPPSSGESVRNDTSYTHYDNGQIKTSTDPWNIVNSYDYNPLGQQTKNTLASAGGSSNRTMTWDYFPSGKLKTRNDKGAPAGQVVELVDNSDINNTAVAGTWTASAPAGHRYGRNVQTHPAGTGASQFVWQLHTPRKGSYEVFVRQPKVTGAATDATFRIAHARGSTDKRVDQTKNPGQWVSLGSYPFQDGKPYRVTLSDKASGVVVADAVKIVRDNSAEADNETKDFAYRYDPNGNLISMVDASPGRRIDSYTIGYTGLNQIAKVEEVKDGAVRNTTAFTFNENGAPLTSKHDKEYATFAYDVRDLVSKTTHGASDSDTKAKVTTYTYTDKGERLRQVKGNGNTVDHTYYLDGLLKTQVEKKSNGTLVSEHTIDYDLNGNRTKDVAKKMNADNHTAYLTTTSDYTYDPRDRIAQLTKTGTGAGTETYVHDANNNVIEQTVKNKTSRFGYDRNRLLTSTTDGATAASYNYDAFGRLDTVTSGDTVVERKIYDGFDHVIEHRKLGESGTTITKNTFDPLDRRSSKTTDAGGTKEKTTTFNYLGLSKEVLDEEVAGKVTKSYQYSPWGDRLSQVKKNDDGTDEDGYYGYNPHTDVEQITDTSGDSKTTYGYTAYGNDDDAHFTGIDKPDTADPTKEPYNTYRFNAKRWDQHSGEYDMGFRDYSPNLNRFLTRDNYNGALADLNLGLDPWTSNRYAFAAGNPINLIELDGHDPYGCSTKDEAANSECVAQNKLAAREEAGLPAPNYDENGVDRSFKPGPTPGALKNGNRPSTGITCNSYLAMQSGCQPGQDTPNVPYRDYPTDWGALGWGLAALAAAGVVSAGCLDPPFTLATCAPALGVGAEIMVGVPGQPGTFHIAGGRRVWTTWQNYPKVFRDGQEYAVIGGRLYSKHAVDRMHPSGMRYSARPGPTEGGSTGGYPAIGQAGGDYGRSVAPEFVEYTISSTIGVRQDNGNISYRSGDLQVITNPTGAVVTVITH